MNTLNMDHREDEYKTVIVGKKRYWVNCTLFASKSLYFDRLFTSGYLETYKDTVRIRGIESRIFDKVYTFLNSAMNDVLDITYDLAIPMYITCQYLLVKDEFMTPLTNFLRNNLEQISILELYVYSMINKDWSILPDIRGYIAKNIELICHQDHFQLLPIDLLIDILTQKNLKITDEKNVLRIVAIWLAYDYNRSSHLVDLLQTVVAKEYLPKEIPPIAQWKVEHIYDTLDRWVFKSRPKRPFKIWIAVKNEPLYLSRNGDKIVVFHYEGTKWTELSRPRIKAQNFRDRCYLHGVRNREDFYIMEPKHPYSDHSRDIFMHYNFLSKKLSYLSHPNYGPVVGLYGVGDAVYSCSRNMIQRYCRELDMWLTPHLLNVSDSSFFASDGNLLYTCGVDDSLIFGESFFSYDERCNYWNFLMPAPEDSLIHCGGFFNNELYIVDGLTVRRMDMRARTWEKIVRLPSASRLPNNLTQCHDFLTIMDVHNNTFMYDQTKRSWTSYHGDYYPEMNVVHCID